MHPAIDILPYSAALRDKWDEFVMQTSRQGTFMHCRDFMEYHSERFTDASLMAYRGKELVAVLPANRNGSTLQSHGGLTYGGWLTSPRHVDPALMMQVFEASNNMLRVEGIKTVEYKPVPWIYNIVPGDDDIYALFRLGARKTACGVSAAIDMRCVLHFNENSQRNLKKATKARLRVAESHDYLQFWSILVDTLEQRHGVAPVHSLDEITRLAEKFPDNIKLVVVLDSNNTVVAGTVLFLSRTVAHAQYIAASPFARENGALAMLFSEVIDRCRGKYAYFDFGISTENHGLVLNEGLMRQKTGFGGRALCYDTYEYTL